ncbi:hypothetical protein [Amycolatopsis sp.]|uniref:hypothetical protein n=1 Tax=Amycolatopsis sp. TaxID=37632 RepID=UPI002B8C441F|nr:hypothetical protein [Amycolatopsis sp.]HVV12607.1 hypothetical protein [Amycolatopsis sp.]
MWRALETDPGDLHRTAGGLGDLLTMDTATLDGIDAATEIYGNAALAGKLRDFADLARLAETVLHKRVDLTHSALRDTATLFGATDLEGEAAIHRVSR